MTCADSGCPPLLPPPCCVSQAGLLAMSIALHQPAESIALLVAFLKSNLSSAQIVKYLSAFSGVGMIGVFLGKESDTRSLPTSAALLTEAITDPSSMAAMPCFLLLPSCPCHVKLTILFSCLPAAPSCLLSLLGLAVNNWASEIWDSVFVALAAGTFIYVGCTEIVAEEFEEEENKWKKFASLLSGIIIVGAITIVTEGWEH